MRSSDFPYQAVSTLTFEPKPQPLSANLRPVYRIALIVLVLKLNCRRSTASLFKLQFFNWILKSSSLREVVLDNLQDQTVFTVEYIHLDPMVNLALKYALGDELVTVTNNSTYKLIARGHEFADRILHGDQDVLAEERNLLSRIGQRVSEVMLKDRLT